jgi:hypothetical protein
VAGWRGLPAGDLSISQTPLDFPLGARFAGRGGSVSGPQYRRFIFPGGGLGARLRLPVLPPGEVGQEKGDGTRADFWIPSVLASTLAGPHTSGLDLNQTRNPETATPAPPFIYLARKFF